MADTNKALLRNSSSIGGIKKAVSSFGKSLYAANRTSSKIIKSIYAGNRDKKKAIAKRSSLLNMRKEAVRRREQEDLVEAGKVGGVFRRTGKVISNSTKGILGRIMDFIGVIMLGWFIRTIPGILSRAQEMIENVQNLTRTLSNWLGGVFNFFGELGSGLDFNFGEIKDVRLKDDESKVRNEVSNVKDQSQSVNREFQRMYDDIANINFDGYLDKDSNTDPSQGNQGNQGTGTQGTQGNQGTQGQQGYNLPNDQSFKESVSATAKRLGISEDDLYAVMAFETGGTFNPAEKNKKGSGATGLIQFMPETAKGLGTTTDDLAKMSRTEQMKYVEKFLASKGISGKGLSDVYMAVLFPAAVGKPDDFVLFGKGAIEGYTGKAYEQNKGLDANNDGSVTKAEASAKVQQFKGVRPEPATVSSDPGQTPNIDQGFRVKSGQDLTSMLGAPAKVTSLRGNRVDPVSGASGKFHSGVDIACATGLYIALRVDCEIVGYQFDRTGYGHVVDVWVEEMGVQLRFAHNSKVIISSPGKKVPAGTSFAITGNSGRSTGPHIHFEADTRKNRTEYRSNTAASPYIPLIMLTRANIQGQPSNPNLTGQGGANIQGTGAQANVASNVSTNPRNNKPMVIPMPGVSGSGQSSPSAPSVSSGGGGSLPVSSKDSSLNSFITRILFKELENV